MPEPRLQLLRNWRKVALKAAKLAKKLYPKASVYLIGGAAEDRLTILSDIDLAIVLDHDPGMTRRAEMLAKLWEELEKHGIPPYYPLHIIVIDKTQLQRLLGRKEKLA